MWRMKSSYRVTQTGTDQKSLRIPHLLPPGSADSALPLLQPHWLLQLSQKAGLSWQALQDPKVPSRKLTAPNAARGLLLHRHPLHFKERNFLFYYRHSPSTGTAWELLSFTRHSKPTQRSFSTEVAGLVCFSVRWIIFYSLGLIPKSFSRKDSYQVSSVKCSITSHPIDVNSIKSWSPLHCVPEHHIHVTTNLSLCSHLQLPQFNVCWSLVHLCCELPLKHNSQGLSLVFNKLQQVSYRWELW